MPEIKIISKKIILDIIDNPILSKGVHRVYFSSVLNFDYNPENQEYSIDLDYSTAPQTILDTISYLNSKNIDIRTDAEIKKIIQWLSEGEKRFKKAVEKGKQVRENPPKRLQIPNFIRKLKPYQKESVKHLVEVENAANFSVPGSGKTTIVYAAYSILKSKGIVDKLFVIGPRSSFMPWEEEYVGCFGRAPDVLRITGSKLQRERKYHFADDYELFLATYQMLHNDLNEIINLLKKYKGMVVLDESHNIKRFEGGRWADAILKLAPFAKRRVVLTGTPMPHSVFDMWTQMTFLWPQKNLFFEREQFKSYVESEKDLLKIRKKLFPLYCRIKKSDLDLPIPNFIRVRIPLSPIQKTIYDAIAIKILRELVKIPEDRMSLRQWRRAKLIRLLQAASNPALLTKYSSEFDTPPMDCSDLQISQLIEKYPKYEIPAKFKLTEKLVRERVSNKQKVIIWTSFVHNIEMLRKKLKDLSPICIYGDVPRDEDENAEYNRERLIREFKTSSKKYVLIANPGATAESISLQRTCRNAIYFDRTFNGAQYLQSLDRIHRIGLKPDEKVVYTILISENTIEEVVNSRLEEKLQRMLNFLDDDLNVSNIEISTNEISGGEKEEIVDFNVVINSLKKYFGPKHEKHDTEYK
ncbi:MAG: DEAD/DEAH box helicase [Methanosarcinales archaeon]|nr:MAG: DEAD/DEAH box helicase [Methanosarcinales archaeon]